MSLKVSISLIALTLVAVLFCASSTLGITNTGETLALSNVHIDMPEWQFKQASKTFALDPSGTFKDKVQYNSIHPDEYGGIYVTHFRNGKCFGIEIIYWNTSVPKEIAFKMLQQLVPNGKATITESDEDELKTTNSQLESYYYFDDSYSGELYMLEGDKSRVKKVSLWHKPNRI